MPRGSGALGTLNSQVLGGLRTPLPSTDGRVGWDERAKRTNWTTGWKTGLDEGAAIADGADKQGNAMGQFGILAQLCWVQGAPSSICIVGEDAAATAA